MILICLTISMTLAALLSTLIVLVVPLIICTIILLFVLRIKYSSKRDKKNISIGFFHPYCTAGGGGERVLWCAIKSLQDSYPDIKYYVYTGDKESDEQIFDKVTSTFDIQLNRENCKFIRLTKRKWVEASTYPRFTLIGQSLGSMILGWEALNLFNPTIFCDTMGYAFTFPIFSLIGGSIVSCYVHYPTISSDMISKVELNSESFNNDKSISSNKYLTFGKLIYYKIFAKIYYLVGSFSKLVMVNGTWTGNHIKNIWKKEYGKNLFKLYPPVDVENRKELPLDWMNRKNMILSIAQFRPEKNHSLQLETLAHLLQKYPIHKNQLRTKLVLVGGVRDQDDRDRVSALEELAKKLKIEDHVEFKISIPANQLNQLLGEASVGIHTMWNEHFGIGVVELMAAGVVPVGNNSGGPKEDIIKNEETGFLATTKEEYAEYIHEILAYREKYRDMQRKARESTERFSESNFNSQWLMLIKPLIDKCNSEKSKLD
ncbi:hypothetical protein DICPUDRAFT_45300 [Dictyostelium purpureum]|uniref:GDP-Man:Man(3)GlcNAc(2)-PP-Dol alpha-1,2-mannosyltransferase n=1 Tax=Dictyostelium purpureum TaxID=5786 RepID=F0Z9Y0_DICPU|nr:uncharacterized protein DICPUDRAFT_45300 [Dictyostelium purpureum]EGC39229.1 hypothetical protein DICPUDRAFT_45300 [Dictyostelium purpureum]|eukprot:XP_003284256.1 hypothetical protein DICPUDRAFT_45300 [Dictyostelium purpureum]